MKGAPSVKTLGHTLTTNLRRTSALEEQVTDDSGLLNAQRIHIHDATFRHLRSKTHMTDRHLSTQEQAPYSDKELSHTSPCSSVALSRGNTLSPLLGCCIATDYLENERSARFRKSASFASKKMGYVISSSRGGREEDEAREGSGETR